MIRLPYWEKKLQEYIEQIRFKPFQYGKHDCCVFTIKAQKILTGETLFPEFDNTYSSLEILKRLGFKTWISGCNARLEKITVAQAHRGDVISMRTNDSFAMGLCMGKIGVFVGEKGIVSIPRENLKLAWRIS